jgi:hypothetical protein
MAEKAREDLHARCQRLLQDEQQKFLSRLPERDDNSALSLAAHSDALTRLADTA